MAISWQESAKAYEHSLAKYECRMASNEVLPESEATEIECSLLPDIQKEELAIEQEMAHLRAQLADLQIRKDTFSRRSGACRKLISPIRRLPADLLLEVFKFRFAEDSAENGHAGRYHLFNINEGPWVLSHVCADWRRAMLSFPSVWSNFSIDRAAPKHHYMFYLELILERSRAHPLDFSFAFRGPGMSESFDLGRNEMFTTLIPTSRRWRNVTLVLNAEGSRIMSGISPLALPSLEHIDLTLTPFWADNEFQEVPFNNLIDMLCRAPKLVGVALEGNDAFLTRMYLLLAQLRRLAIKTNYANEPPEFPQLLFDINLIQACPSLTSLDMSYKWRDGQVFFAQPVISHKTVSSLKISDTALLPSFNFPSLIDLSIQPQDYGVTKLGMAQDVHAFLGRTQCQLQRLSFKNLNCACTTTSAFYAILRDFGQTITELSIEYDGFYRQFESNDSRLTPFWCHVFRLLVVDPAAVVLPALNSFAMTLRHQDIEPWEELADFIQSRWVLPTADVARLRKVVFGVVDSRGHFMYISPECREQYERFKAEGLGMDIWTRTQFPRPKEPRKTVLSASGTDWEAWQYFLV